LECDLLSWVSELLAAEPNGMHLFPGRALVTTSVAQQERLDPLPDLAQTSAAACRARTKSRIAS
jgi:hypothetical protein